MPRRSSCVQDLAASLEKSLRAALKANGWAVRRAPPDVSGFLVQRDDRAYAVELKVAREARLPQLQGLLADAFLRARRAAASLHMSALAVVGAPVLSDRAAGGLRQYAGRFLEGGPYGMVDARGRLELHGPGLDGVRAVGEPRADIHRIQSPAPFDPFSDLNQWMLKVLLAEHLSTDLLTAPREPARNARQLAGIAKVSVPVASRLVAYMKREGWLASDARRLKPLRLQELMRRWRSFGSKPSRQIHAKWALPARDARRQLDRAMAELKKESTGGDPHACVAMFAAAERLGYAHARGAVQHVYYDSDLGRLLAALGAIPAQDGEGADVVLLRAPFRESIFRGAVARDGVLVTDVLQTWLDVASHPAHGQEQAEHLWRRVIAPCVLRRSQP